MESTRAVIYRCRCAWCGMDLGEAPADIQPPGDTHGICNACAEKMIAEVAIQ